MSDKIYSGVHFGVYDQRVGELKFVGAGKDWVNKSTPYISNGVLNVFDSDPNDDFELNVKYYYCAIGK